MRKTALRFHSDLSVAMMLAVIIFSAPAAMGQSGRKQPKKVESPSAPVYVPPPTPAAENKPKPKPDFAVKVVTEITSGASFIFPMPERMQTWFMDRIGRTPLLDVRGAVKGNRRDAIDLAKKDTDLYVVWLQLEDDAFGRSNPTTRPAAGQVWINVSIFSPVTGKAKYSRRVVLNENSARGTVPTTMRRSCYGDVYGSNDYLLLEASVYAADYVMSTFNIPLPPDCSGPTQRLPLF